MIYSSVNRFYFIVRLIPVTDSAQFWTSFGSCETLAPLDARPDCGSGEPGNMSVERTDTRVLIYSHDSFGLGHLRRCRTIAHALVGDGGCLYSLRGRRLSGQLTRIKSP